MNKKTTLMICMMLALLIIPMVSATTWTRSKDYSEEDIREVSFKNWWGLGKEQGNMKLGSHKLNEKGEIETLKVGLGNQVTMYYDFRFNELISDGLGDVEFINMKTGEEIERDYKYVYWDEEEKERQVCKKYSEVLTKNGTIEECSSYKTETYTEGTWKDYNSKDIPKEDIRIGIEVEVKQDDYIDGIWNIGSKKLDKHASWTASLETDLVSYYKLDETSGDVVDSHGSNDGTNNGATRGATGIIGNAFDFDGTNDIIEISSLQSFTGPKTVSAWVKVDTLQPLQFQYVIGKWSDKYGRESFCIKRLNKSSENKWQFRAWKDIYTNYSVASTSTISTDTWYHLAFVQDTVNKEVEFFVDGVSQGTDTWDGSTETTTSSVFIGGRGSPSPSNYYIDGTIDEVGIWSRLLTTDEITQLYNSGSGMSYGDYRTLLINQFSPANETATDETEIDFVFNVTDEYIAGIQNASLIIDGTVKQTNTSGYEGNYTMTETLTDGDYNWWVEAYNDDNDDNEGYTSNNYTLTIDLTEPTISITSPTETYGYLYEDYNMTLNSTATDTNLDVCWYEYNGVNTTFSCSTGVLATEYFDYKPGENTIIVWVNDTVNNLNSSAVDINARIVENSRNYTSSIFETDYETYAWNVTANSSLTSASLRYDGSSYLMTESPDNYFTYSRDIPLGTGDYSFDIDFTYGGSNIDSTNLTQEVNLTYFSEKNATYSDVFLNLTFKDENDLSQINGSISTSEFTYYLGSGAINKTLTFVNNTNQPYFAFSGTTDSEDLSVIPVVQYKNDPDYPQRIWEPSTQTYNSTDTDKVLYLLKTADGIFVTYQVLTSGENPIEDVEVVSTRVVSGETVQIGAGETDSAGTITFWMNPDFQHATTFSHESYEDYTFTHFPTQAEYTITLGEEFEEEASCVRGIIEEIKPTKDFLWQNEIYDFNYTVSSSYWNLSEMKIVLTDSNGTNLGSDTSTSSNGDTLEINDINTTNKEGITLDYYYEIDEEDDDGECGQISGTRVWIIQSIEGREYSIWRLSEDFTSYVSAGFFGIDDFGKTLISFVIIVLMVGGLSRRYGIAHEGAIMGMLFGLVYLLDVELGMIPKVEIGEIVSINHFFTFITFFILLVILIKEEMR